MTGINLDWEKLSQISAIVLAVVQYIKVKIPDKYIWIASMLVGIGASFYIQPGETINILTTVVNGLLGAVFADLGYGFLSKSNSPSFTIPSKKDLIVGGTP